MDHLVRLKRSLCRPYPKREAVTVLCLRSVKNFVIRARLNVNMVMRHPKQLGATEAFSVAVGNTDQR